MNEDSLLNDIVRNKGPEAIGDAVLEH